MQIGYFPSGEEYRPRELVEAGESPSVWPIIAAVTQICSLPVTTARTCRTIRSLFAGEFVHHHGTHHTVENTHLFTASDVPPPTGVCGADGLHIGRMGDRHSETSYTGFFDLHAERVLPRLRELA